MNKSYFEKNIMKDIGSGIRKHRYYILRFCEATDKRPSPSVCHEFE